MKQTVKATTISLLLDAQAEIRRVAREQEGYNTERAADNMWLVNAIEEHVAKLKQQGKRRR